MDWERLQRLSLLMFQFVSSIGTGKKVAGEAGEGAHSVGPEEVVAIVVFLSKFDVEAVGRVPARLRGVRQHMERLAEGL